MTGFDLQNSAVGSDRSTNWATAQDHKLLPNSQKLRWKKFYVIGHWLGLLITLVEIALKVEKI